MKKVAIIGGGLSGLSLAYYLQKKSIDVTIFEKHKTGGLIQSKNLGGDGFIEAAANGFLGHSEVLQIAAEIGAETVHAPRKLGRFIFRGVPRKWPISWRATFKLIGVVFLWVFCKSRIRPKPQESMRVWGHRIFGEEITSYLIEPALRGIFAGDLDRLSASLWFQKITSKQKKNRTRGLLSFKSGMGEFCDKLVIYLQKKKVIIKNQEVSSIASLGSEFACIIVTVAPPDAAVILKDELPEPSSQLNKIEMRSIASLTFLLNEKPSLSGYGCLFPQLENFNALGVLWSRDIFPIHGATPVERWITLWDQKDSEQMLIQKIEQDRKHLYGNIQLLPPKSIVTHFWPQGLPHMTIALEQIVPQLKKAFRVQNNIPLFLHGNYLGEMGTTDLVFRSQKLSQEIEKVLTQEHSR